MYTEQVMNHFRNPKFLRKMENPDGIGKVGNPTCGDLMHVFIKVGKNKQGKEYIEDISVQTFGCVAAVSSSDVLCQLALGKTLEDAEKISRDDIIKELGDLPAIKKHCSVLAQEGLKDAIKEYRSKK
jgi:nitrogen fixation protein NifU and related proteins